MFATVLFLGSRGDIASWMYISCIADLDEVGSYNRG
jgi:hypothetical protein